MTDKLSPTVLENLRIVLNVAKDADFETIEKALAKAAAAILAAPDGSITLKYPPKGVASKIQMRRPKVKDQIAAQRAAKSADDAEVYLFASLCEMDPNDIEELEMYDYGQISEAYTDYAEGKHSPERPTS